MIDAPLDVKTLNDNVSATDNPESSTQ